VSSSRDPAEPTSLLRHDLEAAGFTGWRTWDQLRSTEFVDVPCKPGAYVVLRASTGDPAFLHSSLGGWCKGQDPSVSIERLGDEWVPGAHVVYIGKADYRSRRRPIEGLRKRLWEFARFGAGETIGHRGGRLIWQLADSAELLVAWHEVTWDETARDYEKRLLHHFANLNSGRRPFANLTG
jgi:hypothetical protein